MIFMIFMSFVIDYICLFMKLIIFVSFSLFDFVLFIWEAFRWICGTIGAL